MSTLLLFTTAFPFGSKETFLESEIGALADHFDNILIVPGELYSDVRPLPTGVQLDLSYALQLEDRSTKAMLRKLLQLLVRHPAALFGVNLRSLKGDALRNWAGWTVRSHLIHRWLTEYLAASCAHGRTMAYTYWLGAQTLGALRAKQQFPHLKVVSRAHGRDVYKERMPGGYLPRGRFLSQELDHLFVVSEVAREYFLSEHGWNQETCSVSRLGVQEQLASLDDIKTSTKRSISIASCSNLIPLKRVHFIIEALSRIATRYPEHTFDWNHFGDGPLFQKLYDSATIDLPDNVTWELHGQQTNQVVLDFYADSNVDVFINASSIEGIPVSIMEAQSFGIPSIAFDVGGNSEIVNSTNGLLLEERDSAESLIWALESVVVERPAWIRRRRASWETWNDRYTAEKNYASFCRDLLKISKVNPAGMEKIYPIKGGGIKHSK